MPAKLPAQHPETLGIGLDSDNSSANTEHDLRRLADIRTDIEAEIAATQEFPIKVGPQLGSLPDSRIQGPVRGPNQGINAQILAERFDSLVHDLFSYRFTNREQSR